MLDTDWWKFQQKRAQWKLLAAMMWPFYPIGSDFLSHSLQDSPSSPYIHREGTRVANVIKNAAQYKNAILSYIHKQKGRWKATDYQYLTSVAFGGLSDLTLAIHRAEIHGKGELCCKNGKIKVIVPLDVKLIDDYNYEYWSAVPTTLKGVVSTALNNKAYFDFTDGVLNEYTNWVMFRENRIGKWGWQ